MDLEVTLTYSLRLMNYSKCDATFYLLVKTCWKKEYRYTGPEQEVLKQEKIWKTNKILFRTMTNNQNKNKKNWKKPLFISLGILLTGGLVTVLIFLTEPEAKRGGATKKQPCW